MADSAVAITAGTGTNIDTRTEATNGDHRQVMVVGDPSVTAGVAPVSATAGMKVDLGADNDVTVTGTVTLAALPAGSNNIGDVDVLSSALPTGAATAANQTTIIGHLDGVESLLAAAIPAGDNNIGNVDIVTLPALPAGTNNIGDVDVLSSALPTGASTAANQTTIIGHLDGVETSLTAIKTAVEIIDNAVAGNEMQVDVLTLPALVAGTANIGDVDVLTLPALPAGSNNIGDVDVLTLPNVTLAAGTNTNEVVGDAAHDAPVAGNPVLTGLEARTALGTAVGSGDVVRATGDRYGQLWVTAPAPSHASSNGTPITATTTSVIAAPSAGSHLRVVRIHVSNGGATATWVGIRDGASGTRHYNTYLPQGGLMSLNLTTSGPLDLTTATRLDIYLSAAGSVEFELDYFTVAD